MSINVTLFAQVVVFIVLVWFTMKYVWPVLAQAMAEREKKIADGLAAAERGEKDLELARKKSTEILHEAREQANQIVDQAGARANDIVAQARDEAMDERKRQVAAAEAEISQQANSAREALRAQVAALAVAGAERLIEREIDEKRHAEILDKLITGI